MATKTPFRYFYFFVFYFVLLTVAGPSSNLMEERQGLWDVNGKLNEAMRFRPGPDSPGRPSSAAAAAVVVVPRF